MFELQTQRFPIKPSMLENYQKSKTTESGQTATKNIHVHSDCVAYCILT